MEPEAEIAVSELVVPRRRGQIRGGAHELRRVGQIARLQ